MKVRVHLRNDSRARAEAFAKEDPRLVESFDTDVAVGSSVKTFMENLAAVKLVPFPDQYLVLHGERLDSDHKIENNFCEIDFVVRACEADVVSQVEDLLQARQLTVDELGLLYVYKHGVSIQQALRIVGVTVTFQEFLLDCPERFALEGGKVNLSKEGQSKSTLVEFDARTAIIKMLQTAPDLQMEIAILCKNFVLKYHIPLSVAVHMRPIEFFESEPSVFSIPSRGIVQLLNDGTGLRDPIATPQRQRSRSTSRPRTPKGPPASGQGFMREAPVQNPAAEKDFARGQSFADVLSGGSGWRPRNPKPKTKTTRPRRDSSSELEWRRKEVGDSAGISNFSEIREIKEFYPGMGPEMPDCPQDDQMYIDLHTKISSRSFNSRVSQMLVQVCEVLKDNLPFDIESIVKGGSVGTSTAVGSSPTASATVFIRNVPLTELKQWMSTLVRASARVLDYSCGEKHWNSLKVYDDSLTMSLIGLGELMLTVYFVPYFESYQHTVMTLSCQTPAVRKLLEPVFHKESGAFISRQAGATKITIRLLKWWRDQQQWESELTRPSDEILQLVAIYAVGQTRPKDQVTSISTCMSMLAHFHEIRIVWDNFYRRSDIWAPLLQQKPLLMDPVNPFRNVADPSEFDYSQLIEFASTSHFFW